MSRAAVLLLLLATGLRLFHLGQEPLWSDEMHTVRTAGIDYPLSPGDWQVSDLLEVTQGPLYMLAAHGWSQVFGSSEVALRCLSVLFALAALPGVFLAASRLGRDRRLAWWAMVLIAVNPFHIWYAREVRGYAMVMCAAVWSVYCLLRAARAARHGPLWGWIAAFAVVAAVGLGASFSMVFMLPVCAGAWLILGGGRRARWGMLAAVGVAAVATAPWWQVVAERFDWRGLWGAGQPEGELRHGAALPLAAVPYTLYAFATGFSWGPALAELHDGVQAALRAHWLAVAAATLVFGTAAWRGLRWWWSQAPAGLALLALWVVVPMVLLAVLAAGEVKAWNARYLAVSLPAFLLWLAAGLRGAGGPRLNFLRLAVLGICLTSVGQLLFNPRYWKEDYRGAASVLNQALTAGDAVIAEGAPGPLFYYLQRAPGRYALIHAHRLSQVETATRVKRLIDGVPRAWHFRARAWRSTDGAVVRYLSEELQAAANWTFRGAELVRYDRPGD